MRPTTRTAMIAAALLLAGCGGEPPPAAEPSPAMNAVVTPAPTEAATAPPAANTTAPVPKEKPALAIEAEGLRLFDPATGRASPIPFGTPRAQTLAALAFRGAPEIGTNAECGAGPLGTADWPDGFGVHFQDDKFVGWKVAARANGKVTTAAGIGPGSTRAELEDAYAAKIAESTLGTEFTASALSGILDGKGQDAKITDMWAGVSCVFR